MNLAIRVFLLNFLALDHIFTSVLHINHKTTIDMIGLSHHIPALYNSYKILTNINFWNDKNSYTSELSHHVISYSFAYFLYEIIYHLKHKWPLRSSFEVQMFIHAIMSSIGFFYVYNLQKYHFYIAVFLTWEASTPFLSIANCLYRNGMTHNLIYKINGCLFLVSFVIFRIILGSYIFWYFLWPQVNIGLRITGVTLNLLNIIWLNNIVRKIISAF